MLTKRLSGDRGRGTAICAIAMGAVLVLSGCAGSGRIATASADLLDLIAQQTARTLDEYERDLQALDSQRREAAVYSLAERIKRDGAESVDQHAAALLEALEAIAADRLAARQRYEAAMDNTRLLQEVAAGLQRYGQRAREIGVQLKALLNRE